MGTRGLSSRDADWWMCITDSPTTWEMAARSLGWRLSKPAFGPDEIPGATERRESLIFNANDLNSCVHYRYARWSMYVSGPRVGVVGSTSCLMTA